MSLVLRRPAGANVNIDFQEGEGLAITPLSKDFGNIAVGASATQSFTVINMASAIASSLVTSIGGADASQFVISANTCGGASLSAGGTCSVVVQFAPSAPGGKTATLTVSGSTGLASATLTGSGVGTSALAISPQMADFGSQAVGTSNGMPTVFTLTNTASSAAGPFMFAIGGMNSADFVVSGNNCTGVLAPAATCQIGIEFTPTSAGGKFSALIIGGPGGSASVSLTGTGLFPPPSASRPR